MVSNEDAYKGNNAADYQPPTGNPQAAGSNLQQTTPGLQPTGTESDVSQQRLPSVDGLKVMVIQDSRSATSAYLTPTQTVTQTWVGPFWGCVALIVIGVVVWAVRQLAKDEVPGLSKAVEEAIKEPLLAPEPTATAETTPKRTTKKSKAKKSTKRTKKSRK